MEDYASMLVCVVLNLIIYLFYLLIVQQICSVQQKTKNIQMVKPVVKLSLVIYIQLENLIVKHDKAGPIHGEKSILTEQ